MNVKHEAEIPLRGATRVLIDALWCVIVIALGLLFIGGTFAKYREDTRGIFGVTLSVNTGQPTVFASPGFEANSPLHAGDILRAVNNIPVPPNAPLLQPLQLIAASGDSVTLTLEGADGTMRQITLPRIARYPAELGIGTDMLSLYFILLDSLLVASYFGLGILLFTRRSNDGLALLISLGLIFLSLRVTAEEVYGFRLLGPAADVVNDAFLFIGVAMLPLLLTLFPNGKIVPRWTRYYALSGLGYGVVVLLVPTSLSDAGSNPLRWVSDIVFVALGVLAQVLRYHQTSTPSEKQQTKWVVFGAAVGLVVYYAYTIPFISLPSLLGSRLVAFQFQLWAQPLFTIGMMLVPLAFAFSILRYRLWDIDVLIRRTVTYALLGGTLALIYFASVILFQQIFAALTGQRSEISTILSTLAIAALFVPLRGRIQTWIDKRFNRKKYDAQRVLQDFAKTVRDETDLEKLSLRLLQVVNETMQPKSVSLWVKSMDKLRPRSEG